MRADNPHISFIPRTEKVPVFVRNGEADVKEIENVE
jgi:hypothetical protein